MQNITTRMMNRWLNYLQKDTSLSAKKKEKKNLSKNIDPSKKCLCFCLCAKLCPSLPLPEVLATSFRLPCRSSPSASKNRLLIPSPHSLPVKTHLGHPLITLFIIHSFCPLLFFFFFLLLLSLSSSPCVHLSGTSSATTTVKMYRDGAATSVFSWWDSHAHTQIHKHAHSETT